jgi:putative ABC transport system permease protein
VLPAGFEYPDHPAEAWAPLVPPPAEVQQRFLHRYTMLARLKPGVTIERAREDLGLINARLKREYPNTNAQDLGIMPLSEQRVASSKAGLVLLMAAVGLVLLIACANVASLLLARATARQKEIAIRAALGASRGRLLRQVLTESVLLALAGGTAGIGVAYWSLQAISGLLPANLPGRDAIAIDPTTLAFALAASILTGILFGISPALHASRATAADALRQRSNAGSRRSLRLRAGLVVAEVAVSVVLLVGGALLLRSFVHVMATNPGIDAHNVLSMQLALPRTRYQKPEQVTRFFSELLRRLSETPGVESAGIVNRLPLNGSLGAGPMGIEGRTFPPNDLPVIDVRSASPDYFRAMGIAVLDGRALADTDVPGSLQVAVIDDRIAARLFPGENPIGRRVRVGLQIESNPWVTIIGIVRNVRHDGLEKESRGQVYLAYRQYPVHGLNYNNYALVLRTAIAPAGMNEVVRRTILQVDPDQTAFEALTMDEILSRSVAPRRFQTLLVAAFALLALALASFGLYAVIAYSVTLRTPEIGVRIALGAGTGDVLALVAGETARLAAAGLALGLAGAAVLTRWLAGLLFGVSRLDLSAFAAAGILVGVVAVLATLAPALRAVRVDPSRAFAAEG